MRKEFVMRGQTASGKTEVLNFSGYKPGYAYRLVEFQLWSGADLHGANYEISGSITAGKVAVTPELQDFNDEGLIGSASVADDSNRAYPTNYNSCINDTFLITQNLILMVHDTSSGLVNWQCRFKSVKMTGPEEASTNFKQFSISDG
jgi:hypothetical protein